MPGRCRGWRARSCAAASAAGSSAATAAAWPCTARRRRQTLDLAVQAGIAVVSLPMQPLPARCARAHAALAGRDALHRARGSRGAWWRWRATTAGTPLRLRRSRRARGLSRGDASAISTGRARRLAAAVTATPADLMGLAGARPHRARGAGRPHPVRGSIVERAPLAPAGQSRGAPERRADRPPLPDYRGADDLVRGPHAGVSCEPARGLILPGALLARRPRAGPDYRSPDTGAGAWIPRAPWSVPATPARKRDSAARTPGRDPRHYGGGLRHLMKTTTYSHPPGPTVQAGRGGATRSRPGLCRPYPANTAGSSAQGPSPSRASLVEDRRPRGSPAQVRRYQSASSAAV